MCGKQCGHLVTYGTQAEQYEVESTYISLVGGRAWLAPLLPPEVWAGLEIPAGGWRL